MSRFSIAVGLIVASCAAGGCDSTVSPNSPAGNPEARPTFTLSGVVTQITGNSVVPVEGARVLESRSQLGTSSDEDGLYRISGLPSGTATLRIDKEGYSTSTVIVDIRADARVDIRIVAVTPYVITGVIFELTPSGRVPVAGVVLYCDSCGSPEGHTFTSSDAEGGYRFAWSPAGVHRLLVWKEGFALARPSGSYPNYAEYLDATVNGDTQLDIEVVRR